jgi:hypothetical protein
MKPSHDAQTCASGNERYHTRADARAASGHAAAAPPAPSQLIDLQFHNRQRRIWTISNWPGLVSGWDDQNGQPRLGLGAVHDELEPFN